MLASFSTADKAGIASVQRCRSAAVSNQHIPLADMEHKWDAVRTVAQLGIAPAAASAVEQAVVRAADMQLRAADKQSAVVRIADSAERKAVGAPVVDMAKLPPIRERFAGTRYRQRAEPR